MSGPASAGGESVREALAEARDRGFLGPGSIDGVVSHARGFASAVAASVRILDLGSGGGVPGLVIAQELPQARVTLLEASETRSDWLRRVVARLGWRGRVEVVTGRAEVLGHHPAWRSSQGAVVARSFAPPLVTAESAAGFLAVGGRLVVSEPPSPAADRWPPAALRDLGLAARAWPDAAYAVFEQVRACPSAVPRAKIVRGHTS